MPRSAQALILVVVLTQTLAFGDAQVRPIVFGLSLLVLDALGVIYSVRAARRSATPLTWWLAAASRALSLTSTSTFAVNAVTGVTAWWWVGVGCGLSMFLGLSATALSVSTERLRGAHRWAFVAEVITVLSSGFMVVWYLVLDPALRNSADLHLIFELGYPIGNLLVLVAVTAVLLRGAVARLTPPVAVLLGGILLYAVGDTAFSAVRVHGEQASNSALACAALVIASLLMTVAAMVSGRTPAPAPATEPGTHAQMPAWSAHLPFIAVAVGNAFLLAVTIREHTFALWGGLTIGQTTMTAALAVRQVISLRDSRRLNVTDALTGLANLTGLQNALDRSLLRRGRPAPDAARPGRLQTGQRPVRARRRGPDADRVRPAAARGDPA